MMQVPEHPEFEVVHVRVIEGVRVRRRKYSQLVGVLDFHRARVSTNYYCPRIRTARESVDFSKCLGCPIGKDLFDGFCILRVVFPITPVATPFAAHYHVTYVNEHSADKNSEKPFDLLVVESIDSSQK